MTQAVEVEECHIWPENDPELSGDSFLAVSLFIVSMGNKKNAKRRQSGSRKNKKSTQEIEEDQLSSDESLTPDAPLRPPRPTPKPYHRGRPAYDACHSNLGAEIDDTAAARLLMSFSRVSPSESQATPARTHLYGVRLSNELSSTKTSCAA